MSNAWSHFLKIVRNCRPRLHTDSKRRDLDHDWPVEIEDENFHSRTNKNSDVLLFLVKSLLPSTVSSKQEP